MTGLLEAVPSYVYALLIAAVVARSAVRTYRRRRTVLDSRSDVKYNEMLKVLCEGSARRSFHAFQDIDWDSPEMRVDTADERWINEDSLSKHPWFQAQTRDRQIEMSVWRRANITKISYQFESLLVIGLMRLAAIIPEHSWEHRYCLHECSEELNHILMFRELMARLGKQVPGFPRWLRFIAIVFPFYAKYLPTLFFFAVLAVEVPMDHIQREILREDGNDPSVLKKVFAVHVAEEARHISFADLYLHRVVPQMTRRWRFGLSLYVPFAMRVVGRPIISLNRSFFKQFNVPYRVRRDLKMHTKTSRDEFAETFGDVRAMCASVGLMNPVARLLWRVYRISGPGTRYRGEPVREHSVPDVKSLSAA